MPLLAVIRTFGCRVAVFGYNATRNDKFLVMIATQPVLDAMEILLPSIAVRMERSARTAVSAYAAEVREALPQLSAAAQRRILVRPYFRDYLRGYGLGVAEKIRALRAETIKAEGPELARVKADDEARAEVMFNRDFPDRQPLRTERAGHHGAREAGQKAGHAAGIGDHYLARHDLVFALL